MFPSSLKGVLSRFNSFSVQNPELFNCDWRILSRTADAIHFLPLISRVKEILNKMGSFLSNMVCRKPVYEEQVFAELERCRNLIIKTTRGFIVIEVKKIKGKMVCGIIDEDRKDKIVPQDKAITVWKEEVKKFIGEIRGRIKYYDNLDGVCGAKFKAFKQKLRNQGLIKYERKKITFNDEKQTLVICKGRYKKYKMDLCLKRAFLSELLTEREDRIWRVVKSGVLAGIMIGGGLIGIRETYKQRERINSYFKPEWWNDNAAIEDIKTYRNMWLCQTSMVVGTLGALVTRNPLVFGILSASCFPQVGAWDHILGKYETSSPMTSLVVSEDGTKTCMTDGHGKLNVMNTSDPADPILMGISNDLSDFFIKNVRIINKQGTKAFLTGYDKEIMDISDPIHPELMGNYAPANTGFVRDIKLSRDETKMYIAGDDSFNITNINGPTNPIMITSHYLRGASVLAVNEDETIACVIYDYSYHTPGSEGSVKETFVRGMKIIDISNPIAVVQIADWPTGVSKLNDVEVSEDVAYVGMLVGGLDSINIANPSSPTKVGNFKPIGSIKSVKIYGKRGYLAGGTSGLWVVDKYDLQPKCNFDISGASVEDVEMRGDKAFLACSDTGCFFDCPDKSNENGLYIIDIPSCVADKSFKSFLPLIISGVVVGIIGTVGSISYAVWKRGKNKGHKKSIEMNEITGSVVPNDEKQKEISSHRTKEGTTPQLQNDNVLTAPRCRSESSYREEKDNAIIAAGCLACVGCVGAIGTPIIYIVMRFSGPTCNIFSDKDCNFPQPIPNIIGMVGGLLVFTCCVSSGLLGLRALYIGGKLQGFYPRRVISEQNFNQPKVDDTSSESSETVDTSALRSAEMLSSIGIFKKGKSHNEPDLSISDDNKAEQTERSDNETSSLSLSL
ncbi:MAG: hypothetical protein AMJ43_00885 [Coxiella sp. DG_40]|nr:MAG: hypothetical protein AMJ43_00885 [Coxiella sp. DG_40]